MTKYKDDEGQKMKMMIVMINEKTKYDLKNIDKLIIDIISFHYRIEKQMNKATSSIIHHHHPPF